MRVAKMTRKHIKLNNPNASNCYRDGILFVNYPINFSRKVMIRSVCNHEELAYLVKGLAAIKKQQPKSYDVEDMIEYLCRGYRYSEVYTYADVNQNFLEDVQKNYPGKFYDKAFRLGWVVKEDNNEAK